MFAVTERLGGIQTEGRIAALVGSERFAVQPSLRVVIDRIEDQLRPFPSILVRDEPSQEIPANTVNPGQDLLPNTRHGHIVNLLALRRLRKPSFLPADILRIVDELPGTIQIKM